MKISVDDVELFSLSETQKKVIQYDINEDIFDADMKRRLQYILTHKYENCMEKLKSEWVPKLKEENAPSIPLNDEDFADMIFARQDYRSRKQRDEVL